MFDRLQKPFLTVETGEAYQPVRLTYEFSKEDGLEEALDKLHCIQKNTAPHSWTWYWNTECDDLHFESVTAFRKNPEHPVRLGTLIQQQGLLHINLPSFKRACLAVPFFHRVLGQTNLHIHHADFINKVFALDERLPHGFTELFKEVELTHILEQREEDYQKVKEQCEHAATAEEALTVLSDYTKIEAKKRLPYAERYVFEFSKAGQEDPDVVFLGFYIFLRSRELVAIKRWFGQSGYSLSDAADEIMEQVFGNLGIDLIE